jgi:hypothetical protein
MKAIVTFLLGVYLLGCAIAGEAASRTSPVRGMMGEIAAGKFRCLPLGAVSGWFMTNETGQVFHRAVLQFQGKEIIAVGADAVPELLNWLSHTNMHVRYIAHYCLQQITGEEPYFPHFATLKQLRSDGYLKEAVKCWSEWYAKRKPNQPHAVNSRRASRWRFGSLAVAAVADAALSA